MRNKNKLLMFLVLFLVINISPVSAIQLNNIQKDAMDLSEYNAYKLKNMGVFGKLKLLHKLPSLLTKAKQLENEKIEGAMESTIDSNSDWGDASKTTEMLKTRNITVDINTTTEKVNSTYIFRQGDIVQLKYKEQYIYLSFKEYTTHGRVVLSRDGNEVKKFASDFNNEFTGIRLINPQRNSKTISGGYVADVICQNYSMELEGELDHASSESRYGRELMGISGMLLALAIASFAAAGLSMLYDATHIITMILAIIGLILMIMGAVLMGVGACKHREWEEKEDGIEGRIKVFEDYIKGVRGSLKEENNTLINNRTISNVDIPYGNVTDVGCVGVCA